MSVISDEKSPHIFFYLIKACDSPTTLISQRCCVDDHNCNLSFRRSTSYRPDKTVSVNSISSRYYVAKSELAVRGSRCPLEMVLPRSGSVSRRFVSAPQTEKTP